MNLNKISLIAAVAALMLTGCNNDLVLQSEASDNAIEFRTVMDKTRASLINSTNELTSFYLHAGATGKTGGDNGFSFMNVAAYRVGTDGWTYAPTKYWPGYELDFFAYAPIMDKNMTTKPQYNGSEVTFGYEVPFDQSESNTAVDLLVAYTPKQNGFGSVAIDFEHALSSVIFSAVNTTTDLVFTIHSIEITNLDNKGTYSCWYNSVKSQIEELWDTEDDPSNYIAGIPESGVAVNPVINKNYQWLRLLSLNDYMMILPQEFSEEEAIADAVTVKVVYSAMYQDGKPVFDSTIIPEYTNNQATVYFRLSDYIDNQFKKGFRYNFKFILGKDGYGEPGEPGGPNPTFNPIELDVTVEEWFGEKEYDEEENKDKGTSLFPTAS